MSPDIPVCKLLSHQWFHLKILVKLAYWERAACVFKKLQGIYCELSGPQPPLWSAVALCNLLALSFTFHKAGTERQTLHHLTPIWNLKVLISWKLQAELSGTNKFWYLLGWQGDIISNNVIYIYQSGREDLKELNIKQERFNMVYMLISLSWPFYTIFINPNIVL